MADLSNKNFLVPETNEVKKKWLQCQIQEKKSRITRLNQDIEDLLKGRIVELQATVIMHEKELEKLNEDLKQVDNTVDITE